jgi:Na+/melibiose symporter-like transporter
VFYFVTLLAAAAVVAIALRGSHAAARPNGDPGADDTMTLREALRVPHFRSLLISVFAFGWSSFGVRVSVIPLLVVAAFNGDAALAAWVLAAYAAGNALLIFPSGRWNDTVGRKPMLVLGSAVLAVGYLVLPASPQDQRSSIRDSRPSSPTSSSSGAVVASSRRTR